MTTVAPSGPPPLRALRAVLVCAALAVGALGCTSYDASVGPQEGPQGPATGDCYENGAGECVVASEGCSPGEISGGATERCARCADGEAEYEICGEPRVGTCFQVEFAEPCTRCVADDGALVFSDCPDEDNAAVLDCETSQTPPTEDAPEGETCQVCRDGTGRVVSETCGAGQADDCREEERNGRTCEVCTVDGQDVVLGCSAPTLSEPPRVCETYEGADGSCVDCYGEDDQLILHECSFGMDAGAAAFCETVTTASGVPCDRCYNGDGFLVSEQCDDTPPAIGPERCQELFYELGDEEVMCFVCVDEQNVFTVADCWSNACEMDPALDDGQCSPQCFTTYENGQPCRTCTGVNGQTGTQCVADGDVYCQEEEVFPEEPPPDDDPNTDPTAPEVQLCTVCRDTNTDEVVYEECGPNFGSSVACEPAVAVDGTQCEVCYDDFTGDEVYSTCGDDAMCSSVTEQLLFGENNNELYLPGGADNADVAPEPALVDCTFCSADASNALQGQDGGFCQLQNELCTESVTLCPTAFPVVGFDLTQCADPWGQSNGIDGMLGAMAWALGQHEVVVTDLTHELTGEAPAACEACDCTRGDRFLLKLATADAAQRLLELNLGFYLVEDAPEPPPEPEPEP